MSAEDRIQCRIDEIDRNLNDINAELRAFQEEARKAADRVNVIDAKRRLLIAERADLQLTLNNLTMYTDRSPICKRS
jgi:chromosome segregation ATPase